MGVACQSNICIFFLLTCRSGLEKCSVILITWPMHSREQCEVPFLRILLAMEGIWWWWGGCMGTATRRGWYWDKGSSSSTEEQGGALYLIQSLFTRIWEVLGRNWAMKAVVNTVLKCYAHLLVFWDAGFKAIQASWIWYYIRRRNLQIGKLIFT